MQWFILFNHLDYMHFNLVYCYSYWIRFAHSISFFFAFSLNLFLNSSIVRSSFRLTCSSKCVCWAARAQVKRTLVRSITLFILVFISMYDFGLVTWLFVVVFFLLLPSDCSIFAYLLHYYNRVVESNTTLSTTEHTHTQ